MTKRIRYTTKIMIAAATLAAFTVLVIFIITGQEQESDPFADDVELISEASDLHIEMVTRGLDNGFRIENVHAVQLDNSDQWMVGGLLSGSVLNDVFACWMIDDEFGMVYAADFIAGEYSDFIPSTRAGYGTDSPNRECGILANYLE